MLLVKENQKEESKHLKIVKANEMFSYIGPSDNYELRLILKIKQKVRFGYLIYGATPNINGRMIPPKAYKIIDTNNGMNNMKAGDIIAMGDCKAGSPYGTCFVNLIG